MNIRKMSSLFWAILLIACSLAACVNAPSEPAAQPNPESGLRLTQESVVRSTKYESVSDFADFLSAAAPCFTIPGLNQALIPQGMSCSPTTGHVYISNYTLAKTPSVIAAVDYTSGKLEAEYFLFNADGSAFASHVGGIALTETTLFVSATLDSDGSYSIAAIPLSDLPATGSHDLIVSETIAMAVSPSFLSYSDGILWVGNFYHPDGDYNLSPEMNYTTASSDGDFGCYILGFDIDPASGRIASTDEPYPLPERILVAPNRIQGMAVVDGSVYLSQSYGRKNNSTLLRYAFDLSEAPDTSLTLGSRSIAAYVLDSNRQIESIVAMPMTEGLCTVDGKLLILFESGASRYSDGKYRTDYVWELNG